MTRKLPRSKQTDAQLLLYKHLRELGNTFQDLVPEYQFAEDRRFRFDLADTRSRIGYECDGGMWTGGHMRGKAPMSDLAVKCIIQGFATFIIFLSLFFFVAIYEIGVSMKYPYNAAHQGADIF